MPLELWAVTKCMNHQLEVAALLMDLSLPEGYHVRQVQGRLYLFDPQGIPLHSPQDPSLIEAYAWRHVWRRIDRELNEELADLCSGLRPLHSLRRLRQYLRMLDAVAEMPHVVALRPVRRRVVAWAAFAASAAAVAAVLLLTPLNTTRAPESTSRPVASNQPATTQRPARAVPEPRAQGNEQVAPATRPDEVSRGTAVATRTAPRRAALAKYAVSFGEFVNSTAADAMMHLIRSKGYIVYVAQVGEEFRVVTRPYHTRAQAERLVSALQEIGLPAKLATAQAI